MTDLLDDGYHAVDTGPSAKAFLRACHALRWWERAEADDPSPLRLHAADRPHEMGPLPLGPEPDPLHDDDAALALYLCYEQHYLGLPGVDESWEWSPGLLRERHRLERAFEDQLIDLVGPAPIALSREEVKRELTRLATDGSGPSLSGYMEQSGTIEQLREFAIHRSAAPRPRRTCGPVLQGACGRR